MKTLKSKLSGRKGNLPNSGTKERKERKGISYFLSTMTPCSLHPGCRELYALSKRIHELEVSQAQPSFHWSTNDSGTSSDSVSSNDFTISCSFTPSIISPVTSPQPERGQPGRHQTPASMKEKSTSSKRATWRGGKKRSKR